MATQYLQPRRGDAVIHMFQNLRCNTSSQPSWSTSLTNSSGAFSFVPTAYQVNYDKETHLQNLFATNFVNHQHKSENFNGGGIRWQQSENIGYNGKAPIGSPSRAIQHHRKGGKWTEEDPENLCFLVYLKLCKGWPERKIELLEGSKRRSLLDEFNGLELLILARNQLGSQYLQRIMDVQAAEKIVDHISDYMLDLMRNQYGCYVFQRMLPFICGSEERLEKIVASLVTPRDPLPLISTATTKFGSVSIQKLFQTLKWMESPLIEKVMEALRPALLYLMMDVSGRHLIIDCLKQLSYDQNHAIYFTATRNCIELAEHSEGYHIVSKVIDATENPFRCQLLTMLTSHCVQLATDPNGNFVLQKVIKLQYLRINENICMNFQHCVVELSMHKHGSHVIEKLLETTGMEQLVLALLESDQLIETAKDRFGNYIIQKVLKNSKIKCHHLYQELVKKFVQEFEVIQKHQNAKNVLRYLDIDM